MRNRIATILAITLLAVSLASTAGAEEEYPAAQWRPECAATPDWNGLWWTAKYQSNNRIGKIKTNVPLWEVNWSYYRNIKRFNFGPDFDSYATPGHPIGRIAQVYIPTASWIGWWYRNYAPPLMETDSIDLVNGIERITVCFTDN